MQERRRRAERAEFYKNGLLDILQQRVGRRLRDLRLQRDWTQEQAAQKCGLNISQYQHAEYGRSNLTFVSLVRLAQGFRIDPSVLMQPFQNEKPRPARSGRSKGATTEPVEPAGTRAGRAPR